MMHGLSLLPININILILIKFYNESLIIMALIAYYVIFILHGQRIA